MVLVCINCHKTVNDNIEFCPYCKCRLRTPARRQQSAPRQSTPPASQPKRPSNPTPAPKQAKAPAPRQTAAPKQTPPRQAPQKQAPAPSRPPVKQPPKPTYPPPVPQKKNKEVGGFNNLMAYFILPAFIIFDIIVIFSILNSLALSQHQTSGIFTVCAQTVHLICAVVASHGLKMKTFSSLISLLVCAAVTALQTAVSFLLFATAFDKLSLIMMLATAGITVLLAVIFAPYYVKHKKEFTKSDILFS